MEHTTAYVLGSSSAPRLLSFGSDACVSLLQLTIGGMCARLIEKLCCTESPQSALKSVLAAGCSVCCHLAARKCSLSACSLMGDCRMSRAPACRAQVMQGAYHEPVQPSMQHCRHNAQTGRADPTPAAICHAFICITDGIGIAGAQQADFLLTSTRS